MALRQEELTSLCDDVDLDRDRALVERCQAGDSAAFGNLYARYYERLLRFCLRRLNDRHEAEDAAQEAFARAWKALPRFAGERRFYPWLTVIAGNICTDMLRRRSRSTPTDDMELTAQQPVGVVGEDTSEELVLAAVDGELVNRALDRLSTRHRHVLAMREGSGWTYQQIADHEGVEIGTIETLLWRARQALKREFAVVSESKEALAGFLIATGALIRRTVFRVAHRGATVQHSGGGRGRCATRSRALPSPAQPSRRPSSPRTRCRAAQAVRHRRLARRWQRHRSCWDQSIPVGSGAASPRLDKARSDRAAMRGRAHLGAAGSERAARARDGTTSLLGGALGSASSSGTAGLTGGLDQAAGGLNNTVNGATGGLSQTIGGAAGGLSQTVGGVTGGLSQTVGGVTGGLSQTVGGVTGGGSGAAGLSTTVSGATSGVNGLTQAVGLGSVVPGTSGSGSSGSSAPATTTTTTNPVQGILGGLLGG